MSTNELNPSKCLNWHTKFILTETLVLASRGNPPINIPTSEVVPPMSITIPSFSPETQKQEGNVIQKLMKDEWIRKCSSLSYKCLLDLYQTHDKHQGQI